MKCFQPMPLVTPFKIYEKCCLFWKIDEFLELNVNGALLSLNNISEFKKKRKYFYLDEHLYSTNLDAGP